MICCQTCIIAGFINCVKHSVATGKENLYLGWYFYTFDLPIKI